MGKLKGFMVVAVVVLVVLFAVNRIPQLRSIIYSGSAA